MTGIEGTYAALDAMESGGDGGESICESNHPMRRLFLLYGSALVVSATALAQSGPTVIVLVRHAEKGAQPTIDPPLTEAGMARTKPLAEARGLTVETVALGPKDAHVKAVAAAALAHHGQAVLVVGHSNTIPAIITALGGPVLADLCDTQYAMLYTVVIDGKNVRLTRSTYGTPTPDTLESCPAMIK
jgi:hypothetical protein